jgi:hypothetical protein
MRFALVYWIDRANILKLEREPLPLLYSMESQLDMRIDGLPPTEFTRDFVRHTESKP